MRTLCKLTSIFACFWLTTAVCFSQKVPDRDYVLLSDGTVWLDKKATKISLDGVEFEGQQFLRWDQIQQARFSNPEDNTKFQKLHGSLSPLWQKIYLRLGASVRYEVQQQLGQLVNLYREDQSDQAIVLDYIVARFELEKRELGAAVEAYLSHLERLSKKQQERWGHGSDKDSWTERLPNGPWNQGFHPSSLLGIDWGLVPIWENEKKASDFCKKLVGRKEWSSGSLLWKKAAAVYLASAAVGSNDVRWIKAAKKKFSFVLEQLKKEKVEESQVKAFAGFVDVMSLCVKICNGKILNGKSKSLSGLPSLGKQGLKALKEREEQRLAVMWVGQSLLGKRGDESKSGFEETKMGRLFLMAATFGFPAEHRHAKVECLRFVASGLPKQQKGKMMAMLRAEFPEAVGL